jgi:hypothetical protein
MYEINKFGFALVERKFDVLLWTEILDIACI